MNNKRCFLLVLIVLFAVLPETSCGGKRPETFRVGYFSLSPLPDVVPALVKSSMAELGYVEGENVSYVFLNAGGDLDALPQVAQELVDADVDVIIVVGAPLAESVMAITEDIPLLVMESDHVQVGLVDGYRDHGRNLTGVATAPPTGLQLELLLEIAPDVERIFVPYHPKVATERMYLTRLTEAAADLGVEVVVGEAETDGEVADMLVNDFPDDIDAIFVPSNRITYFPRDDENLIPFAIEHKLPLAVSRDTSVVNGALVCYTYDLAELTKQAIRLLDQILRGTPTSDLPIERPEYYLTINLQTAKAIGLEIPDDVLERAHKIIR